MPLPFKQDRPPLLPNNQGVAYHRLMSLKKKLLQDKQYQADYVATMIDLFDNGYAEETQFNPLSHDLVPEWYLPHHGVYAKEKKKLRVVFDASAKCKGTCLNDTLLQGPLLTNTLVGVLCRFRKEQVAVVCDVKAMFHQFSVCPNHRDYFRFMWFKNNDLNSTPVHYRMTRHIFGVVSSPSCANFALKQLAKDHNNTHGVEASKFLDQGFYADDGLTSTPDAASAVSLLKNTVALCREGQLTLHKFVSNNQDVLEAMNAVNNHDQVKNIPGNVEKTLGIRWNLQSDSFIFNINLDTKPITRRGILSAVCSIYDPLGLISPYVLEGKKILQLICKNGSKWDDPIQKDLIPRYEHWFESLSKLSEISIPRCFKPATFTEVRAELHNFSDASQTGYGQCSYLRLINISNEDVQCSLVMAKSRVTPLKTISIPRLELMAAVLSVKVACKLKIELDYSDLKLFFWTDSQVVLAYISNESRRFETFVANRVEEIRSKTDVDSWYYIHTSANPADYDSRGLETNQLHKHKSWLQGPKFLWSDISDILVKSKFELTGSEPELKPCGSLSTAATVECTLDLTRFERFSSWTRLIRAVTLCLRLKNKLHKKVSMISTAFSVKELHSTTIEIFKHIQIQYFAKKLCELSSKKQVSNSSPLCRLNPFVDKNGLLRVGGRIINSDVSYDTKHPIVLPSSKKCHLVLLLVRHYHEKTLHQGRGITVNEIRSNGIWILNCISCVANYIFHCVTCRKCFSAPTNQVMADLPSDRVNPSPPFTHTRADLFGPFIIKENRKTQKRYGVLFSCLACRAVHVETVNSLTTDSYINALRRFIAVRGSVEFMRSDNGSNMIGAERELKRAYDSMNLGKVKSFLLNQSIECEFIHFNMHVPHASHFSGSWERQIRSIRRVLTVVLKNSDGQLDDESLRTFLCETCAIINSRPLTVESLGDVNSLTPITPNHLLTSKSQSPPGSFPDEALYSRKRWVRVQYLSNCFWQRWRSEVLATLQSRQKWLKPNRNISVGDIVLLKDNASRNVWPLAKVDKVYLGDDGKVRSCRLLVGTSHLTYQGVRTRKASYLDRPVNKLVILVEVSTE